MDSGSCISGIPTRHSSPTLSRMIPTTLVPSDAWFPTLRIWDISTGSDCLDRPELNRQNKPEDMTPLKASDLGWDFSSAHVSLCVIQINTTTMRTLGLALLAQFAVACVGLCDGIPWDRTTGKMTTAHVTLRLSESQMQEFRDSRTVTLTAKQHSGLRKQADNFPLQIKQVVTYRYSDCTCCIGHPYAIMLPGEYEIAIPRYEIARVADLGTSDPIQP